MPPVPESPRPRTWLRPTFSLGTVFWMMLVAGMAAVWWRDRSTLDARITKLEQMYAPAQQSLWGAADILGPPDDLTGGAGKCWCPRSANAADWVEVGFDKAIAAATIDLYEVYQAGCVTEVLVTDRSGAQTSIWKGTDPTPPGRVGLFRVNVPASIKPIERVKIHVDSTTKGSWACIDAVGLTTSAGKTTWATTSTSSSVYTGSTTASVKREAWYSFW
jgi:hypothetical protein